MFLDEVIGAQARGRTGVGEVVEEENGAVLHDLAYDPPQYEVTLMELAAGKLYFY